MAHMYIGRRVYLVLVGSVEASNLQEGQGKDGR